jgi:hypothetical protein
MCCLFDASRKARKTTGRVARGRPTRRRRRRTWATIRFGSFFCLSWRRRRTNADQLADFVCPPTPNQLLRISVLSSASFWHGHNTRNGFLSSYRPVTLKLQFLGTTCQFDDAAERAGRLTMTGANAQREGEERRRDDQLPHM